MHVYLSFDDDKFGFSTEGNFHLLFPIILVAEVDDIKVPPSIITIDNLLTDKVLSVGLCPVLDVPFHFFWQLVVL